MYCRKSYIRMAVQQCEFFYEWQAHKNGQTIYYKYCNGMVSHLKLNITRFLVQNNDEIKSIQQNSGFSEELDGVLIVSLVSRTAIALLQHILKN